MASRRRLPRCIGGPYKASVSFALSYLQLRHGQQAADWLEGKSIPQAMDIIPRALTLQNLDAYERDVADPGAVYRNPQKRDVYLKMYGKHLLRHPRSVPQLPMVVGTKIIAAVTSAGIFQADRIRVASVYRQHFLIKSQIPSSPDSPSARHHM